MFNLTQLDINQLQWVCQGEIHSHFSVLRSLSETNAQTISDAITSWFQKQRIDMPQMHFTFDGAATFTGRHAGVTAQMKAANPHMVSVHCDAHREALAAADACQKVNYLCGIFQPVLQQTATGEKHANSHDETYLREGKALEDIHQPLRENNCRSAIWSMQCVQDTAIITTTRHKQVQPLVPNTCRNSDATKSQADLPTSRAV